MAEPLVIQFAADTSRAQSAMASLAASIAGNMASASLSLTSYAQTTTKTEDAILSLQKNIQRANAVILADAKSIGSATINAATAEKATLESVVAAFTKSAAASETAQASLKAGIAGTTGAVTGIVSQLPTLKTLLGAFLAFEAAKLVFASVSASIDAAREHIEQFVKIGKDAERAGVSPEYFQRVTLGAEKYGLTVDQAAAALNRFRDASEIKIGEGKDGRNSSALGDRLQQNVLAGNITASDRETVEGANGTEEKLRALLDLIEKLKDQGRNVAAFDLAGKFVGPEFERQLRNGEDAVSKLKAAMDTTSRSVAGIRIVGDEEVARADALDERAKSIANTLASALAPIQKDISNSVLDTYDAFLQVEAVIARVVGVAVNLYTQITGIVQSAKDLVNQIPYIGRVLTAGNPITLLREAGKAIGAIGPDAPADASTTLPEIAKRADRSRSLPSLAARSPKSGGESLDAVETLINQIEKARDTAKAELENVAKTNVERERAVALAKAEAAAREDFKKGNRTSAALDDDERTRVLAAADAWQTYKDRAMDANQALRAVAEQQRYFGQIATEAFGDAILEGRSFADVLGNLEKQIAKAALQGIFTGQGPLASLLGTAPAASSGSNAVGGLAGLFGSGGLGSLFGGGFKGMSFVANGGPVAAGQPYTVGEMGRELFVPGESGRVYPIGNGGNASGSMNVTINEAPGGDRAVTRSGRDASGNPTMIVDMISRQQAADIVAGRGPLADVSPGARRLRG